MYFSLNMKTRLLPLILSGILFLLFSCRKDKTEIRIQEKIIDPTAGYWKEFEQMGLYSNFMMDVVQHQNLLYFISSDYVVRYDSANLLGLPTWTVNKNIKPAMDHGMIIFNQNDSFGVFTEYPNPYVGPMGITGKSFLDFKTFISNTKISERMCAVNDLYDKGFMLYNCHKNSDSKDSIYVSFGLFSKRLVLSTYSVTDYKSAIMSMPLKPFYITGVKSFFGKYFIASSDGIIQVDTSAQYNSVLTITPGDVVQTMFRFRDTLYAVSNYYLYRSTDKGNNWSAAYSVSSDLAYYKFKQVDDELFAYRFNSLIKMNIFTDSLQFTQINNKGIGNRPITGIEKLKGKIYLTTLAGTFVKPYTDLFKE